MQKPAVSGNFSGQPEAAVINSDDLKAPFSSDKQSRYAPVSAPVKINGGKLRCDFPPHSFTQIKVTIKH